tara:strand:- start:22 stop:489 length:468 start_codon:yes stop_codon:yes gene_type:complete
MEKTKAHSSRDKVDHQWPKYPLVELVQPFIDVRGSIQPILDEAIKSAILIESNAGSIRANHYHKTDWHYCYVISGAMEYYHRKTGSEEKPEKIIVNVGNVVFTPPMVDHAMYFSKDTVFLALSRNPRDQKSYEEDVVRIELLSKEGFLNWRPDDK